MGARCWIYRDTFWSLLAGRVPFRCPPPEAFHRLPKTDQDHARRCLVRHGALDRHATLVLNHMYTTDEAVARVTVFERCWQNSRGSLSVADDRSRVASLFG